MKALVRRWIPLFVLQRYARLRRTREQQRNRTRSVEDVFTEIYTNNKWGGAPGEFCSGDGSSDDFAVTAYVSTVGELASREGFVGLRFVDLGCGDFRVGRRLLPLCSSYVGVDIVQPLISRNQQAHGGSNVRFVHLDVVNDELPDGDVCFVRQVLQHLSNQQIAAVLKKLSRYPWVFITEHYPAPNDSIRPNLDKVHGGDVRVYENSGVYLSRPPFDIPDRQLSAVLEVPGVGTGHGADQGVLRTYQYKPGI